MNRPTNPSHGLKPFQMYTAGAARRETQNIFELCGQTHVNYRSHAGQPVGEFAYLDGATPVHTCLAKDFLDWSVSSSQASVAA